MKISVIIPVYNTEKFIARALDSILSQDYKNYEVICIDDGSIDKSAQIIKQKSNEYPCIKYYYQENQGPGAARRNGLSKASGELLFFVDSDDFLLDDFAFSKIVNIYEKYNPDVLFFNTKLLTTKGEYVLKPFENNKVRKLNNIEELANLYITANLYSKIFKRELLNENMFIESNTFEDFYTSYLYLDCCKKYYYLDEALYCCYHGEDNSTNLTSTRNVEKIKKNFNIINLTYLKVNSKIIKSCIANYCSEVVVGEIVNRPKRIFNSKERNYNKILKEELNGIYKIAYDNKDSYLPNGKYKFIKKIIYYLYLKMCI